MGKKSEDDLIATAREACGSCNWTLGECAAEWTERYAKGRTDADFAALMGEELGLTSSKVGHCRRVWTDFGMIRGQWPHLTWSHFRAAKRIPFTLVEEALTWANDVEANVREMLAWVRASHGEAVVTPLEPEAPEPVPTPEQDPTEVTPEEQIHNEEEHNDRDSSVESDVVHIEDVEPEASVETHTQESGPTTAQINATCKQLEMVTFVVRNHWPQFKQSQRDRVHACIATLEQNTR